MEIQFVGATKDVTGSCHLVKVAGHKILLDCGLFQGRREDEARNRKPFPFNPGEIDAVVLSHAHIDHSGRIPLLVKAGFKGPIYTQKASRDLCRIMLKDSGYLHEKDAEWDNRKRERKGLSLVEPLYTVEDAQATMRQFKGIDYDIKKKILSGITLRFRDAGHILGSAIVELWLEENGVKRKIVFSGDLGNAGEPILRDPTMIDEADLVLMESTYGDRLHRSREATWEEIHEIASTIKNKSGNILIPAFAVGRSQGIIYTFGKNYLDWELDRWKVFLDSPMAIEATEVYVRHSDLYDEEAAELWRHAKEKPLLPNLRLTRTANQSMQLNKIHSGAIIIAGSGMCTGGRIRHHLKHNIWRSDCHVIIVGFQARGTTGRALVDGTDSIKLWGETIRVAAKIHTVGGLSAHADQAGLLKWYQNFKNRPPIVLVHGEEEAMGTMAEVLETKAGAKVTMAEAGMKIDLVNLKLPPS
ncbi:MAG TPA: MBL fold metallo-hydrolase [Chromatiales bacterium]|nr:MBL fold metallo-hydrolase [Thiotrichales bacterium]HIP67185.1 MBL fold metallo-hydrolase [Chromatiales bacterium]